MDGTNRSFASGKTANDKNYRDVIFIIPPVVLSPKLFWPKKKNFLTEVLVKCFLIIKKHYMAISDRLPATREISKVSIIKVCLQIRESFFCHESFTCHNVSIRQHFFVVKPESAIFGQNVRD